MLTEDVPRGAGGFASRAALAVLAAFAFGCGQAAYVEEPQAAARPAEDEAEGTRPVPNVTPDDPMGKNAKVTQLVNYSKLVFPGEDGRLVYRQMDKQGNRIPDFSRAGYGGGGVAIPVVPARAVVGPDGDEVDDTPRIQAAVDKVQALPVGEGGFRGAVLIRAGTYRIEGSIRVTEGGVVLRGEGKGPDGTVLRTPVFPPGFDPAKLPPEKRPGYVIEVTGAARVAAQAAEIRTTRPRRAVAQIVDEYAPVGARTVTVSADLSTAEGFKVGDRVRVTVNSNGRWREAIRPGPVWGLRLDGTEEAGPGYWAGRAGGWDTVIEKIEANKVTFDTPLWHCIAKVYGEDPARKVTTGGSITSIPWPDVRIGRCGVENLRLVSDWTPVRKTYKKWEGGKWVHDGKQWQNVGGEEITVTGEVDPVNHRGQGILMSAVQDSWVRDVYVKDFFYTAVMVAGGTRITVQDSTAALPDGKHYEDKTYVARYAFHNSSSRTLFQRCYARSFRHGLNFGAGDGPRVFLDCRTSDDHGEGGAHKGYQKGLLMDSCRAALQSGSRGGAVWRDINTVFWNCGGELLVVSAPPAAVPPLGYKWAIGCYATPEDEPGKAEEHREWWRSKGPMLHGRGPFAGKAVWDSWGEPVDPRSLYEKQLEDRLGWQAVRNSRARVNWAAVAKEQEARLATYRKPVTGEALRAALAGWTRVAADNLGARGQQPHLAAARWREQASRAGQQSENAALRTQASGDPLVLRYAGLDGAKSYRLVFAGIDTGTAAMKVSVDGSGPVFFRIGNAAGGTMHVVDLPRASFADGRVEASFRPTGTTRFAALSVVELWQK